MSDNATYLALKAEIEVLRRQLEIVMARTGISTKEADDAEFEAVLDRSAVTRDYSVIKNYLKNKRSRRAA